MCDLAVGSGEVYPRGVDRGSLSFRPTARGAVAEGLRGAAEAPTASPLRVEVAVAASWMTTGASAGIGGGFHNQQQ